jgi:hypothetical protein
MASHIGRRKFLAALGGAAAAWPLAARAQERGRVRRVGVFMAVNADEQGRARVAAFTERLREFGWVEGRNIRFDVRWLGSETGRASEYAAELVRLSPDLLVANGPTVLDLQRATSTSRSSSFRCRPRRAWGRA